MTTNDRPLVTTLELLGADFSCRPASRPRLARPHSCLDEWSVTMVRPSRNCLAGEAIPPALATVRGHGGGFVGHIRDGFHR